MMSIDSIKQNVKSINDAYQTYSNLISQHKYDKNRAERLRAYIFSLSQNLDQMIKEERENVRQ